MKEDKSILWGTATAAYQVEGNREADGRAPSIWDAFDTAGVSDVILSTKPSGSCTVQNCENAAQADNDYVRYEDSAQLTSDYGFSATRVSISMPRVMNYTFDSITSTLTWSPNQAGIEHYKSVFAAYKDQDIKIACTMWHWDLPLAIEEAAAASTSDDCRGPSAWLCFDLVSEAFASYSKLLMDNFADDVAYWITINEPLTIVENGYAGSGPHAPGRCSDRSACFAGNDLTEPYLAAKGLILAHAQAFRAWESAGKPGLGCGVTLNGDFRVPYNVSNPNDVAAAERDMEWQAALFADPIHFGKWPESIENAVGERLKDFGWAWTDDEIELVMGTHDEHFFMNTYTSGYTRAGVDDGCGWNCDAAADTSAYDFETNVPIGTPSSNGWLYNYGRGIGELMTWYNNRYPGQSFIVTENGWGNATAVNVEDDLFDYERCDFFRSYIGNMSSYAAKNQISVKAYFAWSLMDNYEWADGFTTRFGITYVDYDTQERTPKLSAKWFQTHVTAMTTLPTDGMPLPACESSLLHQA